MGPFARGDERLVLTFWSFIPLEEGVHCRSRIASDSGTA